ncbi:acetyl-CoA carboxylase biotin carboxylase subunit family protein [Vibrio splendidus]|uniref:Acetyl-CoA carboxylase biotin carboxylase subunit family protein n=1 Tax=Vibrio splendidus TaxID=29497 RepID=A0ABV4LN30_VIBSP
MNILILDRIGHSYYETNQESFPDGSSVYIFSSTLPAVYSFLQGTEVDLNDHVAVVEAFDSIHNTAPIDLVIALSEQDKILAATLQDRAHPNQEMLGLANRFRDKTIMKNWLSNKGIRVPEFGELSDAEKLFNKHTKIIIKPIDGFGSTSTYIIENKTQLTEVLSLLKSNGCLLDFECEEFIDGDFFHIDSVVHNGEVIATVTFKYNESTLLTENSKHQLSSGSVDDARLAEFNEAVIKAMELKNGVTHHEVFRKTGTNELVFCEIANRTGGGGTLPAFEAVTGYNLFANDISLQAQKEPTSQLASVSKHSGQIIFHKKYGEVISISDRAEFSEPWIHYCSIRAKVGDVYEGSTYSADKIATFAVLGDTPEEVTKRLESISSRFNMDVK